MNGLSLEDAAHHYLSLGGKRQQDNPSSVSIQVGVVGGNSSSRHGTPQGHQLLVVVVVMLGSGSAGETVFFSAAYSINTS